MTSGQANDIAIAMISGVPQGTVLGPVLFTIFINDVTDIFSDGVGVKMFADDIKMYAEINCDSDKILLQDNLLKLEQWSKNGN